MTEEEIARERAETQQRAHDVAQTILAQCEGMSTLDVLNGLLRAVQIVCDNCPDVTAGQTFAPYISALALHVASTSAVRQREMAVLFGPAGPQDGDDPLPPGVIPFRPKAH